MSIIEVFVSALPLLISLAIATLIIGKTGAFGQRAHRKRVEELLERIAQAVEKNRQP